MKKTFQPFSIILLLSVLTLIACNNYGKKIPVSGTKAEVYYKGEGVTEADARKAGDFFKKTGFVSNEKEASIQLTKVGERYLVRFVYSKDYYEKNKTLEDVFKKYGAQMSKEIFDGQKVDIALADKHFEDFKSIPFDEASAKTLEEPKIEPKDEGEALLGKDDFEHDKAGGVDFYWKGVSDKESKTIADYIVQNGSFAGGTAEIYITKDGDRYILRFPVRPEYRNDISTINEIEKVSKEIKENVFPNTPYSFQMTDERLMALKSFDY